MCAGSPRWGGGLGGRPCARAPPPRRGGGRGEGLGRACEGLCEEGVRRGRAGSGASRDERREPTPPQTEPAPLWGGGGTDGAGWSAGAACGAGLRVSRGRAGGQPRERLEARPKAAPPLINEAEGRTPDLPAHGSE